MVKFEHVADQQKQRGNKHKQPRHPILNNLRKTHWHFSVQARNPPPLLPEKAIFLSFFPLGSSHQFFMGFPLFPPVIPNCTHSPATTLGPAAKDRSIISRSDPERRRANPRGRGAHRSVASVAKVPAERRGLEAVSPRRPQGRAGAGRSDGTEGTEGEPQAGGSGMARRTSMSMLVARASETNI